MPYTTNIYSVVRNALIEENKSIPQIAKTLGMSSLSIETMVKSILDYNKSLNNDEYHKIRSMIVVDSMSPKNVAKLLEISYRSVRYALLDMEDVEISNDIHQCVCSAKDDASSDTTESTETTVSDSKVPFRLPIEGDVHLKATIYFNHANRHESDIIRIERKPHQEHGIYYISYTTDVPDHKRANQMPARSLLEADGIGAVMDYIKDTLDLLKLDTEQFKSVDVMLSMYPTITMPVGSMMENSGLILRTIEDALASERYVS